MHRDIEVHDSATIMAEDDEYVKKQEFYLVLFGSISDLFVTELFDTYLASADRPIEKVTEEMIKKISEIIN